MFRIYTKEKNSRELFNVNLNAAEVAALMGNNLFLDHPEINPIDCIIVEEEEAFKHPTFVEGIIREKTREELIAEGIAVQLEVGEKIENKKLIKIEQPSQYHTWNGREWSCNLEQAKEVIREKFKTMLHEKRYAHFEYEGNTYQMGITDIPHFEKIKMGLDILDKYTDIQEILNLLESLDMDLVVMLREHLKTNPNITKSGILAMLQNYEIKWRLVDNSMVTITYKKVLEILVAWIFRDGCLNNIYNNINLKIAEANCIEELLKINWE